MVFVLKLLLGAFLLIPNLVALGLFWSSGSQSAMADLLSSEQPSALAKSGPFLAQGQMISPSGLALKSLYLGQDCVAYRTRVAQNSERYTEDAQGNDRTDTASSAIFEEVKGVDDLSVAFDEDIVSLPLPSVRAYYQTFTEELDEAPSFVPKDKIPSLGRECWFSVSEDVFTPGQSVFVAASRGADGVLAEHPELGQLIVFPGTRQQCADQARSYSRSLRIAAGVIVAVSLLLSGILAGVLKAATERARLKR